MNFRTCLRRVGGWLPPLLFAAAAQLAAFAGGIAVTEFRLFPYEAMRSVWRTAPDLVETRRRDPFLRDATFVDVAPERAAERRFEFFAADALTDPVLVPGGFGRFSDLCPDAAGCLAVEYAGRGEVVHAWPWRPRDIEAHPPLVAFPYERPFGADPLDRAFAWTSRYADGDLLAVFDGGRAGFPYAQGAARLGPDGRPVWRRLDYSHHAPALAADDTALIPALRVGDAPSAFGRRGLPPCEKPYIGHVHIVDGEGTLLKEIDVLAALLESPWAHVLERSVAEKPDPCDPLHINAVRELGPDADGAEGMEPGDLVVSLRGPHAFVVLDRDDGRVKKLARGSFRAQHAVTHLEGSRFLMFDNLGADGEFGPSRLLMVDMADGSETAVFPNAATPERLRGLYSHIRGHVSLSPDRRRAWATFFDSGTAVEVRLSDGAALAAFFSLHDVSHLDMFPEERETRAVRYGLGGVSYAGARQE